MGRGSFSAVALLFMSRKIFPLYILAVILLAACGSKGFSLEFSLPAATDTNYTVRYYASDKRGGMTVESVVIIAKGKGSIKCPAIKPCLLYLYTGSAAPLAIFAERGDKITVEGKSADPYAWTIGGNDINLRLSQWRNDNAKTLAANNPDSTNLAVARFVMNNPEAEIAPILLLTSFSRNDDETLFRRLWQRLPDQGTAREWARMAARADMPDGIIHTPGRLRSMAMRSLANGIDTICPDSVKATILFFWNNGLDNRKETFDSIKALVREFSDSASRVIADVCLDPDSLGWRSPLRSDSLEKVVRMWAPAGMADPRLMRLGVTRSPFYIVFSPDGHQRYRGDNREDAFKTFRSIAGTEAD